MKQNFQITALPANQFKSHFKSSDKDLSRLNAHWLIVDQTPGYPCRVTLEDAKVGEKVLACYFEHHQVSSAYCASGPIFVREKAVTAQLKVNQVPQILNNRQLSLRAYDHNHMMVEATLVWGKDVAESIQEQLNNTSIQYIHIHNALPGCFSCAVERA